MGVLLERLDGSGTRICGRSPAARLALGVLLAGAALAAGCAWLAAPTEPSVGPVRVRVGAIDAAAFDAANPLPGSVTEGIERLVDLFWQSGCRGRDVTRARLPDTPHPDVVCRLPGRTPESVVVAAYVDPKAHRRGDWAGPALLAHLYAALSVEKRQHSFVFVGLGHRSGRGLRSDLWQLKIQRPRVRAIVDVARLRMGSSALGFLSSDPYLRHDLSALSASLGKPGEPLRVFALQGATRPTRGGAARITIASLGPERASGGAGIGGGAEASDREASRSAARTIAVFLAYLDETLRLRADGPTP